MIYYFSGTGNSQWVAEQIAARTNDKAFFIPLVMRDLESDIFVGPDEAIGVVFPIYAWAPPEIVMQFLQHVHVDEKAYAYAIATCGSETGGAFDVLKKIFPFKSAYSIIMPNNYIPMFNTDSSQLIREKLCVAQQFMPIVSMNITSRGETIDIDQGSMASIKTKVINPLFVLLKMKPSKFFVDKNCTGCGVCESSCPFGTIKLVDGKPAWNGRCEQCMSCIMRCPAHAIQCGGATRNRKRYVNPYAQKLPAVHLTAANTNTFDKQPSAVRQEKIAPVVVAPQTKTTLAEVSELWKKPVDIDAPVESEETAKFTPIEIAAANQTKPSVLAQNVEFIQQRNVRVLQRNNVLSRQLVSPVTSPDAQATVSEVHLQLGASQGRHIHQNAEQIWYMIRGSGKLLLSNNQEKEIVAGDVVRFPANAIHGIYNDGTDEIIYLCVTTPPLDFTRAYTK